MSAEQLIDITPPPKFAWGPDPLFWWIFGGVAVCAVVLVLIANRRRTNARFKALTNLKQLQASDLDSLRFAIRVFISALLQIEANAMSANELQAIARRYSPNEPLPKLIELLGKLDHSALVGEALILDSAYNSAVQLAEQAAKQQIGGQV